MKVICRIFFSIFLVVPESIFAFISGILLSTAINIATSQLPNNIFSILSKTTIISMFLMLLSSILFMLLGISVKPYQEIHANICDAKDFNVRSKDWLSFLTGKSIKLKWCILLFSAIFSTLTSVILIII